MWQFLGNIIILGRVVMKGIYGGRFVLHFVAGKLSFRLLLLEKNIEGDSEHGPNFKGGVIE